jgi:hypothetical protein
MKNRRTSNIAGLPRKIQKAGLPLVDDDQPTLSSFELMRLDWS